MKSSTQQIALSDSDRFGRLVAARLSEAAEAVPHDISERLRAARVRALAQRKLVAGTAQAVLGNGGAASLAMGEPEGRPWHRLASIIPLLLLLVGLVAVNLLNDDFRAKELAEIDAAILTDDLPPAAYTDPGFLQFLKARAAQPTE